MMTNSLSYELQNTAAWRRRVGEKRPEDPRNLSAAEAIERLAAMDADVHFDRRHEIAQEDTAPGNYSERVGHVFREIGFSWHPKHVNEVLDRVAGILEAA